MMISAHVCLRRSWSSRILHHTIDNEAVYTVRQTAPWPIRFENSSLDMQILACFGFPLIVGYKVGTVHLRLLIIIDENGGQPQLLICNSI